MGLLSTPISVGNKVVRSLLDMDTPSRMARAKEQGFDTDKKVYHGTADDFDAFDPDRAIGTQFWSTTNKAEIESGDVGAQGRGVIKEMYHRIKNPAGWEEYDKFGTDELIRKGYDGLKLPDGKGDYTYVAFDPSQYRSVDAAFDPAKSNSTSLLASNPVATATAGAGGLLAISASDDSEAGVLGKPISFISNAIKSGRQFLYHSGDRSIAEDLHANGIEPQHGKWIKETLNDAVDNPEEYLNGVPAAAWFSDAPSWVKVKAARAANKNPSDMTKADIEKYGHLSIVDPKSTWDEGSEFWVVPSQGIQGDSTRLRNLSGQEKSLFDTPLYEYNDMTSQGKYTQGLEPNDIVTTETIDPTTTLTGKDLVSFLEANYPNYLNSSRLATTSAGLLANMTGQPSNLSSYMQGNTDAYLTAQERAYLNNRQEFESLFDDDTGFNRADILPFRINQQTGERELATPQMIKGLLSSLYDLGQSPRSGIHNQQSILDLI